VSARYDIPRLKRLLDGIRTEDNPALVKQKSRDFYWYSPVLKRQLDEVTGDLLVSPKDEAEVVRVLEVCFAEGVPVTPRGSGTGNYGQAMPLEGGIVLSLADLNGIGESDPDRVIAGAGAILADIDRLTRADRGREIRMFPSTYNTASIGGFVAGGSGGVGSITWGGLRDLGNILRLRVVTMEATPRVLDLQGEDLVKVAHAYGTNGIITEVEMPLADAHDWVEIIVGFPDFSAAAAFGNALGEQDGILKKLVTAIAAPIPHDCFLRHRKFLPRDRSVALLMIAPAAMDAFLTFARRRAADILYRSDLASVDDKRGLPPIYELSWNHTTLRALRVDPAFTYLQVLYPFPTQLEKLDELHALFGDEVPAHVEFARVDGKVTCFGLPLVRFTTEARLDEIIRIHEDLGCPVFNPHRFTLEEGGMKRTDAAQLAFKRQADPKGLLNPGKMLAWENPDWSAGAERTYLFPAAG
jgi:FAD/FMN-containing dehydrogenase